MCRQGQYSTIPATKEWVPASLTITKISTVNKKYLNKVTNLPLQCVIMLILPILHFNCLMNPTLSHNVEPMISLPIQTFDLIKSFLWPETFYNTILTVYRQGHNYKFLCLTWSWKPMLSPEIIINCNITKPGLSTLSLRNK